MGKKIKVLMVEPIGGLAGSERVLLDVLSNFRDNNELIFGIFTPELGGFREKIPNSGNIRVFPLAIGYLHEKSFFSKVLNFSLLFLTTIIFRPHIIHINQAGIYKHTGIIARIFKIPQIVHIRIIEDAVRIKFRDIKTFNIKRIISISNFIYSKLENTIKPFTKTIYDPFLPFSITEKIKKSHSVIGCVGRVTPTKKQHLFVNVAKEILQIHPSMKFSIYGKIDDMDYFHQLTEVAGKFWNKGIFYAGFKNSEEIFNSIDILIHPTDIEPLGRVILEAISSNVPVIVPDAGGAYEIVKLAGGGLIFEANNISNIVEKTTYMIKNCNKFQKEVSLAKSKIKEIFSIDKYIKGVSNVYKEVVKI